MKDNSDDDTAGRPPITDAQRAARRENGKKSRGPVTPEGKAESSKNASVHGIYSNKHPYVERGPLAEDPYFVDQIRAAVIEDLDPRGVLETIEAANIAEHYVKLARVTNLEAYAMGYVGEGLPTRSGALAAKEAELLRKASKDFLKFADIIMNYPDPSVESAWEERAMALETLWEIAGCPVVPGLAEPHIWYAKDLQRWLGFRTYLLMHVDLFEAENKFLEAARDAELEADSADQAIARDRSLAAKRVLDDRTLEKTSAISERWYRSLDRAYERYARLRSGE